MKLSAHVYGEWLAVPCQGTETVRWLAEEALRRYNKAHLPLVLPGPSKINGNASEKRTRTGSESSGSNPEPVEVRMTRGGARLDWDDQLSSVLDDHDFVTVVFSDATSESEEASVKQLSETSPIEEFELDGSNLSSEDLVRLGKGGIRIKLSEAAVDRVSDAREVLENILKSSSAVYGVNTGFGKFANTRINNEDLAELQENLIRSHAAGVGEPLSIERTRTLLALRINVLAKGYSGISLPTLLQYIQCFNNSCLSWVPEQGTVGASGDLAPLSHLALGLIGDGKMWSPKTGWDDAKVDKNVILHVCVGVEPSLGGIMKLGTFVDLSEVLEANGLKPIKLGPKEGLALINGTQMITALGAEALVRADAIARQADVVAAVSLEVLKGTTKAFDADIHRVRPHRGQGIVAQRFRSLLHSKLYPSEISESHRFCNRVQDAYTMRCCPQVHGIVNDTIEFVREIINTEINSATDNPMVFAERGEIISGGNFHGEYPAKALDYLAIGVNELANISERRVERLINPAYSELPAFLTKNGGLNSGFMIAHCTAAALVSENKVLCHPSSVDTLSTSAGTEDHVSMGGFAARKAIQVVKNVENVLAIELLAACQAIEFLRPLTTTAPLEEVYRLVRSVVPQVVAYTNAFPGGVATFTAVSTWMDDRLENTTTAEPVDGGLSTVARHSGRALTCSRQRIL